MMKQHWYDKGFKAFEAGYAKMESWDTGAKYFNEGWKSAEDEQRWDEEAEKQNKLAGELEDLKNRICNYSESLDLDSLTELLYDMGARA
jgi:hypothetical protein